MNSEVSNFSVVISAQDPLTRLGMKQIAIMSIPDCDVNSDINSLRAYPKRDCRIMSHGNF